MSGELCFASLNDPNLGTCQEIVGICTELEVAAEGKQFGESCDPAASSDPCAGLCVAVGDDGAGECEQSCRVGAKSGCGADNLRQEGLDCAFFAYDLSDADIEQGIGDQGVCAHLCDCNADCPGQQSCLNNPTSEFRGVCAGGIAEADTLPTCPDQGGIGGAAGNGNQ